MKPKGNIKIVDIVEKAQANKVGISAVVICEDEEGNLFSGHFAYFVNELAPYSRKQGMALSDWCRARSEARDKHPRRWLLYDESAADRIELYLAGHPADEFTI